MKNNTNEINHSDHLGSSSYITDNFGRPSHYYEYLPFGELMTEHNQSKYYIDPYPTQNMDSYNNPYKFNAKEMDKETGMYYYGARYYDPRISIFVCVDPLAEGFPAIGGYVYTLNNPINLVDPTGMAPETDYFDSKGNFIRRDNDGSDCILVFAANTKRYISPSMMKTDNAGSKVLAKIAAHYSNEMGLSNEYKFGGAAPNTSGESSAENPAFTRSSNNLAYFNNIDGFSTSLDNVNSFKSILRHENKHQVNNENKVPNNNLTHAEVYLYQMKHAEFKDAPTEFQSKMVGSFWNYLYNAEKSKYGDA